MLSDNRKAFFLLDINQKISTVQETNFYNNEK